VRGVDDQVQQLVIRRVDVQLTSPAVMSAMRITPSSITRDSALMMSLSSASARVSISSSLESGPG